VRHARASVDEKRAQLKQRRLDLSYTVIRSPVDGVVISRDVDVGQTVAASLQAPTLFTIARDLRNMQVEVSVDEADIGQVKEGQRVVFTVDSFPEREYAGRVTQIRKAPTEESSVVTYTVIVDAANTDFSLLPGMTATVSLIVGARENVLRVENAALRFRPPDAAAREQVAGTGRNDGSRLDRRLERMAKALALTDAQRRDIRVIIAAVADRARAMRAQGGEPEEIRTALQALRENSRKQIEPLLSAEQRKKYRNFVRQREQHPTRRGELWTLNGAGELMPVRVTLGISDGSVTELVRTDLEEGAAVVVGRLKAPESPRRGLRFGF
jgi:HlyD family secretion protein